MKNRFGTVDLVAMCKELQDKIIGMRVNQIYDIDWKTYLIRLQRTEEKAVLLLESGNRIHCTNYEWPKQPAPSSFAMKMRKHIKNKRLESLTQLGVDRIVDLQFGSGEASYHLIVELYDRGNMILTDHEYVILNLLRPRTDNEERRIAVGEKYPHENARLDYRMLDATSWEDAVSKAKPNDNLKKLLNPRLDFGPALIEHCLLEAGFPSNAAIGKGYIHPENAQRVLEAMKAALELCRASSFNGYIIQKKETRLKPDASGESEDFFTYAEYHPHKYIQFDSAPFLEFPNFSAAVDEFYSKLENQKLDLKVVQHEKLAMKKLENVLKDRENRLAGLQETQETDKRRGEMIQFNLDLVEKALLVLRSAIANQLSWSEISQMVKDAQDKGDPIAGSIRQLKLEINHFTMALRDPYDIATQEANKPKLPIKDEENEEFLENEKEASQRDEDDNAEKSDTEKQQPADSVSDKATKKKGKVKLKQKSKEKGNKDKSKQSDGGASKGSSEGAVLVDIDINLSAYANARRYYDQKRHAAMKEQKTIESTDKAFKSAQRKTKEALKESQAIASVNKARKPLWFEKFYWFISSENYLVIGGRDQQQNELIVKRYLRQNDIYVHADLHGASSVVIKNPSDDPVPPKTLNEAGTMAICYSSAWDAKVITNAWWVNANQVTKTAPTGEYLTTGSFMIRGKKNVLMPSHLIMGFGFLFKLEESSVSRHKDERRVRTADEEAERLAESIAMGVDIDGNTDDVDIPMDDMDDDEEGNAKVEAPPESSGEEIARGVDKLEALIAEAEVETQTDDVDNSSSKEEEEEGGIENEEIDAAKVNEKSTVPVEFPDTKVRVVGSTLETEGLPMDAEAQNEVKIFLGDDQPIILKPLQKQPKQKQKVKTETKEIIEPKTQPNAEKEQPKQLKRGQKSKLKKIKEKYKDQDEEERQLRMEILQKHIGEKELNPKTKRGKRAIAAEKQKAEDQRKAERAAQQAAKQEEAQEKRKKKAENAEEERDDDDDDEEEEKRDYDLNVLNTFTGCPVTEDELLFALPMVAPYAVFSNYKFKLKMTPGTAKRGKATKTALGIFLHDKAASQREKDLLKCVKDHDLTRNFPGKVKLSSTSQQRRK